MIFSVRTNDVVAVTVSARRFDSPLHDVSAFSFSSPTLQISSPYQIFDLNVPLFLPPFHTPLPFYSMDTASITSMKKAISFPSKPSSRAGSASHHKQLACREIDGMSEGLEGVLSSSHFLGIVSPVRSGGESCSKLSAVQTSKLLERNGRAPVSRPCEVKRLKLARNKLNGTWRSDR
jgi:hypothetical protein